MKKVAAFLAAVMVLSAAGCSDSKKGGSAGDNGDLAPEASEWAGTPAGRGGRQVLHGDQLAGRAGGV